MRVEVISGREIDDSLWSAWETVQGGALPELRNPFFHPGYVSAIGSIRDDVRVGVIEDGGRPVGFFPFELGRWGIARPAGLRLNDYQGVVIGDDVEWDPMELMAACGISAWDFDHLVIANEQFRPHWESVDQSPILEVEGGIGTYEQKRRELGIKQYRDAARRGRKLEKEIGPYRIEILENDGATLRSLMDWKSEHCQRTGTVDYFGLGWPARLIERVAATRRGEFSSVHSALFVEDRLLASQFFMRAFGIWHFWVIGSDVEFNRYSPSLVLLREMLKVAGESGGRWIDLGKGMHLFKQHWMTSSIAVAAGTIERPSIATTLRRVVRAGERWARNSVLYPVIRYPGRVLKARQRAKRYE